MRMSAVEKPFSDGFSHSDDIFNRKRLHENIMRVAINAPDKSLVLALDDKWGNGKTSFVKMMESEITKNHTEQFKVIYFDAFKNDYQSDPFVALTSSIYSLIADDVKLKSFCDELVLIGKKIGAALAINGAKLAFGALTGGLASGTKLEEVGRIFTETLSSQVESYIAKKIQSSEDESKLIEEFGEILTKIHKKSGKKIIFIIDELDRARPDFSLDLLEKIKHIFSVQGIIFLLVMNREQFEKNIEHRYGNINSRLYLNKFIHYWFTLPKVLLLSESGSTSLNHTTIIRYLNEIDKENKIFSKNKSILKPLAYLLEKHGVSLREAERCYSILSVIEGSNKEDSDFTDVEQVAIGFVAFLKVHDSQLLFNIAHKYIELNEVIDRLKLNGNFVNRISAVGLIDRIIRYHFATNEQLATARKTRMYSMIEGADDERIMILEPILDLVEGFETFY